MDTQTESKHTTRYDVMRGTNCPMRVLQWATAAEVDAYCALNGLAVVSDRQIGLVLREVTVAKTTGSQHTTTPDLPRQGECHGNDHPHA